MNGVAPAAAKATPWYRRRNVAIGAVVALVLAVTVLTDLPVGTSHAQDVANGRSVVQQINTDLGPCSLAVHQALGIWVLEAANALTPSQKAGTPGLLGDDQAACSFTNQSIFDLSNIEVPGTPSGKHLSNVVSTVTLWATADALRAIEDVQILMNDPTNASTLANLAVQERRLAADRRTALAEEGAADKALGTRLALPDLPVLPHPAGG